MEFALAAILDIDGRDVPDFGDDKVYLENIAKFLNGFDLAYVQVLPSDPVVQAMFKVGEMYHTVEGLSPRGGLHACVGLNGKIVWDPHPEDGSQHGLVRVDCFGLLVARMS